MTAPTESDIQHTRGDDFARTLTFSQPIANFDEIWFTIREGWARSEADDADAVDSAELDAGIEAGAEDNEAVVSFTAAETLAWLFDEYVYDVQVKTTGGKIYTALRGRLFMLPDVTRST